MRVKALCFLSLGLGLAVAGCGDDDGTDGPTDGGPVDTGTGPADTGVDTGTTPPMDSGTDMDAGTPSGIEECDPFAETSGCGDGEKCAVVIDRNDPEDVRVLFGCVPTSVGTKPQGLVCGRLAADATPDDTTDDVVTDECAEGLFCWQAGSPIARCHPLCGDERVECETDQYCSTLNSEPVFGICSNADGCDPVFQTGCGAGEGCYLVSNTAGDLLGTCFEFAAPDGGTGAPGEDCMFINNCQPGTQCFPEVFPDGGTGDTVSCRSLCNAGTPIDAGVADMDAGDLDGGVPAFTGECEGTDECAEIPVEGTAMVPTTPGVCQ